MKRFFLAAALLAAVASASAFAAQSYRLTKYDNPALASACYAIVGPYNNHFDAAVVVGSWGICGYSDRTQRIGPGSVLHDAAIFHNVSGTWKFVEKGNGYWSAVGLEQASVPANIAPSLATAFRTDICARGGVPATHWFCSRQGKAMVTGS